MTPEKARRVAAVERTENLLRYGRRASDAPRPSQYRDCRGFLRVVRSASPKAEPWNEEQG